MEVTEVRFKFSAREADRLKAYCSVTFDGEFVIRDVRIVEGTNGLFVAMPSRKVSAACPQCNHKNPSMSRFCGDCGAKLPPAVEAGGRTKLHRDIAHPITTVFRQMLHQKIIEAYQQELERAGEPDYEPRDLDAEDDGEATAPAAEEVVVENDDAGLNEYDALIAGLRRQPESTESRGRGPVPSRGHRPPGPPARRPAVKSPPQEGSDSRRRMERSTTTGRESARPMQREPAMGRRDSGRPAPPASERPAVRAPAPVESSNREPAKPRAEIVASKPKPVETPPPRKRETPVVTPDAEDEGVPFGAGIV